VTSTVTASSGNISPDVVMFTITNAGLIPVGQGVVAVFSNGAASGDAFIDVDGTVNLRTASSSIASGSNIRLTATYIVA
jgi:hypothetical protein